MEDAVSQVQQCYVSNSGPILFSNTAGFLATERFRLSTPYVQSFMQEWRILWTRPENRASLNLSKLEAKTKDGTTHPGMYCYSRRFDASARNFVLTADSAKPLELWNSFASIGDFTRYMKARSSELETEMGGKISRNIQGLKSAIETVSENMFRPIHVATSDPDLEDPLLLFDNPLRRMSSVTSDKKWPVVQIGETGFLTAYQTGDHNLAIINLSHDGCTAWVVIHPSFSERFLQKMADCVHAEGSPKIAFQCVIRNRNYSVTLDQLEKWKIKYTLLFQEEGDAVILFPGVIHARCNMSFCINSSMNFLPLHHDDVDIILKFKECFCFRLTSTENRCHGRWIPDIPLMANKLILEWMRWALLSNTVLPTPVGTMQELAVIQEVKTPSDDAAIKGSQLLIPGSPTNLYATTDTGHPKIITIIDISSDDGQVAEEKYNAKNNLISINDNESMCQMDVQTIDIPSADFMTLVPDCEKVTELNGNEETVQYLFAKKTQVPEFYPQMQIISSDDQSSGGHSQDTIILPSAQFNFSTIDQETLCNLGLTNVEESVKELCEPPRLEQDINVFTSEQDNDIFFLKCPQCSRKLSNPAHLKRHIYLKHSSEDISVQCPICLRRFANKMSLENHRRSKSGGKNTIRKRNRCRGLTERVEDDKRIRCQFEFCKQLFVLKSGYFRHLRKVHQYHIKPGIDQIQTQDSGEM